MPDSSASRPGRTGPGNRRRVYQPPKLPRDAGEQWDAFAAAERARMADDRRWRERGKALAGWVGIALIVGSVVLALAVLCGCQT